jgi:hypothetical protein
MEVKLDFTQFEDRFQAKLKLKILQGQHELNKGLIYFRVEEVLNYHRFLIH